MLAISVARIAALFLLATQGMAAGAQGTIDPQQFCERTEAVRIAILEAVPSASSNCDGEPEEYQTTLTASDLSAIDTLDLNGGFRAGRYIAMVNGPFAPGDLDGLTGVRKIYCDDCSFGHGNSGADPGARALRGAPDWFLGQLEHLSLRNRDLNRIEEVDFFRGLRNLRSLSLERNNMVYELPGNPDRPELTTFGKNIDPEVWKHLPNLRKLWIGSNRILTLPRAFFRHLVNLEELDMFDMWYEYHPYGFGTQALVGGTFEGLSKLRRLDLGYNALGNARIADGFFDGLPALEFLDLRDNPLLQRLPASVLDLPAGVRVRADPGILWPGEEPDSDRNTYSIFALDSTVEEGLAPQFVIDRTGRLGSAQSIRIEVSETGAMLTGTTPERIEFLHGWTEKRLYLSTDDDTSDERNSKVDVRIVDDPAYNVRVPVASVTVTDNDEAQRPPPAGGISGGGGRSGGGVSANRLAAVERPIEDQRLGVGEALLLDIHRYMYDRDPRALDYAVESADPSVAAVEADLNGVVTITGHTRGVTKVSVTATDRREESASQSFLVRVNGPAIVPFFPQANDPVREGFVRIVNHDRSPGEIAIHAFGDRGGTVGPVKLVIGAGKAAQFNARDIEEGNAAKGLSEGIGQGEGAWCLVLESDLDFEVLAYVRTHDGFLTAMHDAVPFRDGAYRMATFNPGSNVNQVSWLRLVNPEDETATVAISAVDDTGESPGSVARIAIPPQHAVTLSADDLESGGTANGAIGDGDGKWRLSIRSETPVLAMSLLSSPTGHLTNLSTRPNRALDSAGRHVVPFFPAASDPLGRQGLLRVLSHDDRDGIVRIDARDDSERPHESLTFSVGAHAAIHINSDDLELGNADKGLSGSTGRGVGDWQLALTSERDIEVLAYVRTRDGFLTSMHDVAPAADGRHWVPMVNSGRNKNQVSHLRLLNSGAESASIAIEGTDDEGAAVGEVTLTLPPGSPRTISASELESGGKGLAGTFGPGAGKWRLWITADQRIHVMSLLSSPTGHLTNLSTVPGRGSQK